MGPVSAPRTLSHIDIPEIKPPIFLLEDNRSSTEPFSKNKQETNYYFSRNSVGSS